jgi:hypothetical protein
MWKQYCGKENGDCKQEYKFLNVAKRNFSLIGEGLNLSCGDL